MKAYALLLCLHLAHGIAPILDEIQRLYMRMGIPFRENIYLDNLPIFPEYDFIVVGSGPGGSSIANRLSEVPRWKVLLLEAGLEGNIYDDIPIIAAYTILGKFSVNYDVEKEDDVCLGLVGGRCHWPSGNGLGGATLVNGMLYTRGFPQDYDNWALQGNWDWSYKGVLPYFLKSENMSIPELAGSEFHATGGPVHVQNPFISEVGRRILQAGRELGYDLIDYNNPNTMVGFARSQATIRGVKRHTAASAYLVPVKSRPNLHVVKNALVTKVLINPVTKRAYGVKFIKNNKVRKVRTRNEVIVSGGSFGSPKLLMLSGIGPAQHLHELGIPIISNLPVGNNLQEHLGTPVTFLINKTISITLPSVIQSFPFNAIKWLRGEMGMYSSNVLETLAFIRTKYAADDRPDIELIPFASTLGGDGGAFLAQSINVSREVYDRTWRRIRFEHGFTIAPMLLYPKSRGNLRLRSADPRDPIVIDANFFSHPYDVAVLIEGIRAAIRVAETKAFREIGARLYTQPVFGCEDFKFNSDEYWECAIRAVPTQFHHQCGTCRMGTDPRNSVVDPRLRVYGVAGLRVADASIMPTMPGLHTMAPSYMIGEKAADLIKEDWGVLTYDPS